MFSSSFLRVFHSALNVNSVPKILTPFHAMSSFKLRFMFRPCFSFGKLGGSDLIFWVNFPFSAWISLPVFYSMVPVALTIVCIFHADFVGELWNETSSCSRISFLCLRLTSVFPVRTFITTFEGSVLALIRRHMVFYNVDL